MNPTLPRPCAPAASCGILLLSLAALSAQVAPKTTPAAPPTKDEVVTLSPFEVVSDNKGYFASNSMSGTRFNTKVEDLASSLTVITKEQMSDFAMLDINDIFLYAASTEGTGTYTDFVVDRNGSVIDNVQANPTQANRVRGIAAANISLGNIETMGRVPVDPLGVDSVELSRGPNANVFGLGNPSGTLNMVPSSANLSRDRTQATVRVDSYEGYRGTLDANRVLIPGKLAARVGAVFQHDAYERKPSGTNTIRYNGMLKFQPFKQTTISGSYSYYRMNGNRPNALPPRDSLSFWVASGRPTWDPVLQIIHVNGTTLGNGGVGTTTPITADANVPAYFNRSFTGSGRSYLYVDPSGLAYWGLPQASASTGLLTATLGLNTTGAGTARFMAPSSASGVTGGRFTNQPLFTTTPTLSDKAVYDWSSINLSAPNRLRDESHTFTLQVDQIFLHTPRHTLAGQFGWMREDSERDQRNILGVGNDNGQSGQLMIDVNEKLLDGTPNPFFLRPYLGQDQPRTTRQPARWDTYRAQAAYKLDLTKDTAWTKWLGMHQLTGYDEYKYRIRRQYSYKDALASTHAWIPAGTSRANQGAISGGPAAAPNITRGYFRYYVGDANGANVDYAPGDFSYGNYTFVYGNPTTGFVREPALLSQVAVTDATGAGNNLKTIIKSQGGVMQSHFLNDRVVTTFGLRQDKVYQKAGSAPQRLAADGMSFDFESIDHWAAGDYRFNSGKTKTGGVVVRPFKDVAALNREATQGTGFTRFLAGAARGLAFTYNKSDNFTPADPRVDIYLNPLPNPTGSGKDFGFWLNLLDGRMVVRVNRYENKQLNARGGDAGTIAQRVTRTDVSSTAAFLLQDQATAWVTASHPTWTSAQILAEVARQMGMSTERQNAIEGAFNAGTISATQDLVATGTEIEVNFNPTRHWTVSASFTEAESRNERVSKAMADYIAERMPIWTTIRDERTGERWWTTNYGGSQTAAQNYATFVETPYLVVQQQEGKANPQVRRYNARISTNVQLAGFSDNSIAKRFSVGGAVRWEDKTSIGYYGLQTYPAVITALDPNRPIWDKARFYLDAFVSYRTRLWADRIPATFRLNVRNLQENGRLQAIGAFPDGTPHSFRIIDPRQFILSATFDL
jgi:hypothetical protein